MIISRSLLKPRQFLAVDMPPGELRPEEHFWALGIASHSGQAHHMECLARLSEVARAGEDELFCPRHFPLDPAVASIMQNSGIQPTRMHHPCSGKHLLHLAASRAYGHPVERYWDPEHPLQRRLAAIIGKEIAERPIWMTDSCGLPTFAVSARAHLNMWERLATNDDPKVKRLRQLWTANARLVGGYGRLESDLMEVMKGRIIVKEGADGLLVVVSLPEAGEPAAACLIKLASGYSTTYLALALWSTLSRSKDLPKPLAEVQDYLRSRLERWVPGDQELILPPYQ
jgi:L-asparaginase II